MNDGLKKWLLILTGSFTWILTMFKSGLPGNYGYGFWGANGHDGLWHIALASQLSKGNLSMPTFSGNEVKNYHLGFDFLMVLINKLSGISFIDIYFRIIPVVFSLVIGLVVYKFVKDWTKNPGAAFWSVFFVYFGGSLGFVFSKGESAFWSQQAISTLINPPLALSFILLVFGILLLKTLSEKITVTNFTLAVIVFGTLVEVKAYAGLLGLSALLIAGIYRYIKNKKSDFLFVFLVSSAISYFLTKVFAADPDGVFIWQPFWFLETMLGLSDRVGWPNFYSAIQTYKSGHIFIKLVPAYLLAFLIFMVGNFGTRIISLFDVVTLLKNKKQPDFIRVFIYTIVALGTTIPLFYVQTGTPWNTIQFFYYSLFFSGILSGIHIPVLKNKTVLVAILLMTVPTTIQTLRDVYVPERPPAMLGADEISALNFLKSQPDGVVLTYPFDEVASKEAESSPPRPLYLYTTTAYVSAFSQKQTFLEDYINLEITGFDWVARKNSLVSFYLEKNEISARSFLKSNNIKYIYWVKPQRALLGEGNLGLTNIYENKTAVVYKVE